MTPHTKTAGQNVESFTDVARRSRVVCIIATGDRVEALAVSDADR